MASNPIDLFISSMSSHYELQVLRAENVVWASSSRANPPNLYVKLTLGETVQKTPIIKRNITPFWTSTLVLPMAVAPGMDDLTVELKQDPSLGRNKTIGVTHIEVKKLLADSLNGEAKVELYPSDSRRSSVVTGVLFLRMKAVEERQAIETALNDAENRAEVLTHAADRLHQVEEVQNQVNESKDVLQSLVQLAEQVDGFVKFMDSVATIHPYLNVTWQLVSSLQKAIKGQVDDDKEVVELICAMKETFEAIKALDDLPDKLKKLDYTMVEFFKQSTECCTFIREYTDFGFIRRMATPGTRDKIQEFKGRFDELKAALTQGVTMHTTFISARISETVDITYLQQQLKPDEMDAANRPQCLPGTRVAILNEIMDWVFSSTSQNILWLRGVAGSGKSTVSMTIAKYCLNMSRQGAHLFFLRGKSNPNAVIRTIAFWLASFDRAIADHIVTAVKKNNGISMGPLESQFEKLLLEPLRAAADAMTGPVAIVLDALDECGSPDERSKLMNLFRKEFPNLPPIFRFIITSRPEEDLLKTFALPESVRSIELDYTSRTSKIEVSKYLDLEMRSNFNGQVEQLSLDWNEAMDILGSAADGLFIWASTAIKLVKQSDVPAEELEDLVEICNSRRSGSQSGGVFGLDELYDAVLENSGIQWHKPRSRERFAQILGLILFSKVPVSLGTIDDLLGFPSHRILARLASVLSYTPGNDDVPVRLFHTSFSDYLLSPARKERPWFIDETIEQSFLATRCFDLMADKLTFNICGLESSFVRNKDVADLDTRVKERIPPPLLYACEYWAQHLCGVPPLQVSANLLEHLTTFGQQHLMYWFEVLSITKCVEDVAWSALHVVSVWASLHWPDISSLLWGACEFALAFSYPISTRAPHIYLSALSLGMHDFAVAEHYSKALPVIQNYKIRSKPLLPCFKVFSEATGVSSVAFSPDGRQVASGSVDGTVRVWDMDSGKLAAGPFEGHVGGIWSVAFSPNGRRIASGSSDKTICIWDVDSGKLVSGPFEGQTDVVSSMAFSPNGRSILSGSSDGTIRIWDVDSGKSVSVPFEGVPHSVFSVAFSPDGRRIVSGSSDKTILVWDVNSGKLVSKSFEGHEAFVSSVAYSPDGRCVASGSFDGTIRVWDVDSGELVSGLFEGHADVIWSIAFSPNGRSIVSGSRDMTVRVWDVDSGKVVSGPFEEHTGHVWSVAFSPDGRWIASGSFDGTVRIWDVDSNEVIPETLSADGRRMTSASDEKAVFNCDERNKSGLSAVRADPTESNSLDISRSRQDPHELQTGQIPEEICVGSSWNISKDGWLLGKNGELIIWIPEHLRRNLWHPSNPDVLSSPFSTKLDFAGARLGVGWYEGYPRKPSE